MTKNTADTNIGKYIIQKLISQKADYVLYLVEDDSQQQRLLEKYTHGATDTAVSRLKTLQSVSAAQIIDAAVTADDQLYIVLPYGQGTRLSELLTENPAAFTAEQSLNLVRRLGTQLAEAHAQKIYHADIHPENIWVTAEQTAVFLGWGLTGITDRPIPTDQLGYTAPEIDKSVTFSAQANMYSLGVLLFTLLAHHPPQFQTDWDIFSKGEKTQVILLENARAGLATETYHLVRNCLWRQPWGRYNHTKEFLAAIDAAIVAESTPVKQKKEGLPIPSLKLPGNVTKPVLIGIGGLFLFGLVTLLFRGIFSGSPTQPTQTAVPAIIDAEETVTKTAVPTATSSPTLVNDDQVILEEPTATSEPITNTPIPSITPTSIQTPTNEPSATPTPANTAADTLAGTNTPSATSTETGVCVPVQPLGWIVYTIQANDALFNLALEAGTTVEYVQEVNCLANDALSIGQTIFLPVPPVTNTPTPDPNVGSDDSGSNQPGNSQPRPTQRPSNPTKTPPPPP